MLANVPPGWRSILTIRIRHGIAERGAVAPAPFAVATELSRIDAAWRPAGNFGPDDARIMIATRRSLNFTVPLVLDPPRHCGLSSIALVPGRHLLGSAADCDIRLSFAGVQPRHAIILVGENRTIVKSMDARTWVNDGPLTEMALRPGDRLSIGPVTFRVRSASKDEIAAFETAIDDTDVPTSGIEAGVPTPSYDRIVAEPVTIPVVEPIVSEVAPPVVEVAPEAVVVTPIVAEPIARENVPPPLPTEIPTEAVTVEAVSLDARLDEIQQRLAELELTATSAARPTDLNATENALWVQSLRMREADVLRRVEQLAVDTKHLQERSALVVTEEAQLEQQRQQLALEAQRIAEVAESTRRSLSQEHAQHLSVWQDWEAAYQRMTTDVTGQLDSVERQRQTLQAEADRLSLARTELQRVRSEHEQVRKATEVAQHSLAQERAELTNLRSQFETHRIQSQKEFEEQRRQIAAVRRELDLGRTELTVSAQQMERDRQAVMAERSEQVKRLEIDNQRRTSIQSELEEERRRIRSEQEQLSAQQVDFRRQQVEFEEQQARIVQSHRVEAESANRKYVDLLQQCQQFEQQLATLREMTSANVVSEEPRVIALPPVESLSMAMLDEVSESLSVPQSDVSAETQVPIPETWPSALSNVPEAPVTSKMDSGEFASSEIEPEGLGSASADAGNSIWNLPAVPAFEAPKFPPTSFEARDIPPAPPAASIFPADWTSHLPASGTGSLATRSSDPWGVPDLAALSALSMSLHPTTSVESLLPQTGIDPWGSFTPSTDLAGQSSSFEATAVQLVAPPATEVAKRVAELEADSTATPHFDPLTNQQLTADQTLAVVNRDYGVPVEEEAKTPVADALPSWWVEAPQPEAVEAFKVEQPEWVAEALKTDAPVAEAEAAPSFEAENNPTDLRSTLAMLFDIPATAADPSDGQTEIESSVEPVETAEVVEKSVVAEVPASVATDEDLKKSTSAEDSVEEFMARLLARSRGDESKPSAPVVAPAPAKTPKQAPAEDDAVSFTMPAEQDRSHLMAAPKHKQDKQAVRDNLKSFRQVAHLSARSALARHSLQQLRNATIAKGILLGSASLATMWFFAHPLWGREIQMWKAGGCALAALLSAVEFSRSWTQLFKPLAPQAASNAASDAPAADAVVDDAPIEVVVEAPAPTEMTTTEASSEETPV